MRLSDTYDLLRERSCASGHRVETKQHLRRVVVWFEAPATLKSEGEWPSNVQHDKNEIAGCPWYPPDFGLSSLQTLL